MAQSNASQQASPKGQRRRNRGLKKIKTSVEELKVMHRGKRIRLMFQDEAGFGRINIPPYTPEMNPIEQIWKEIRKRGFRNEIFATLE